MTNAVHPMDAQCFSSQLSLNVLSPDLKPGDHICYFYHDPKLQLKTAASFLADGLRQGQRCLYIAVDQNPQDIKKSLEGLGVRTNEELEKGRLIFLTKEETYLKNGHFTVQKMLADVRQTIKSAQDSETPIIRAAGEMSWALEDPGYLTKVVEYELGVDCLFLKKQPRVIGLCQYNTLLFPPSTLIGVRLAHRSICQD